MSGLGDTVAIGQTDGRTDRQTRDKPRSTSKSFHSWKLRTQKATFQVINSLPSNNKKNSFNCFNVFSYNSQRGNTYIRNSTTLECNNYVIGLSYFQLENKNKRGTGWEKKEEKRGEK